MAEITFRTEAAAEVIGHLHELQARASHRGRHGFGCRPPRPSARGGGGLRLGAGTGHIIGRRGGSAWPAVLPRGHDPHRRPGRAQGGRFGLKVLPRRAGRRPHFDAGDPCTFSHLGVRTIPTGGVTPKDLREWLDEPSVVAVGGTWIASRQAIVAGDWERYSRAGQSRRFDSGRSPNADGGNPMSAAGKRSPEATK